VRVASISQVPEDVRSVMCQMMAKDTTDDPNRDRFWLSKKSKTFRVNSFGPSAGTLSFMISFL